MPVNKRQFAINSLWKMLEQFSAKGISVVVSIILARLLLPGDYGVIALTTIFTNLSDILIDGGFSTALITKESVDDYDYSAVFSVSSSIAVFLYIILFFESPFIAKYYDEPQLIAVLRVIGVSFFVQAFTAVRNGIVNRNMQFKLLFLCNSTASVVSGIIGIVSAYFGCGVWALVLQRLSQQIIMTILLFMNVKWKIHWRYNSQRIKEMLSFSLGVVGSSLLNFFSGSIYGAVIGKKYSVTNLGYYDKGSQLPMQFSLYTFGAMSNVLLPTISSYQNDLKKVKKIIRKVVCMTSFLIMPLMAGLAITSKEVISLLFTDKWLPSVPIVPSMCVYYLVTPYILINVQLFFALGKSKLRVKTEIIRLILMVIGLYVISFIPNNSMLFLAYANGIIAVIVTMVTYVEARKLIAYTIGEVLRDIIKPIVCTGIMSIVVLIISQFTANYGIVTSFVIKAVSGITVYTITSFICKSEGINEMFSLIRRR